MATDKSYSGAYIIILFRIINPFLSGAAACERVTTSSYRPRTHERARAQAIAHHARHIRKAIAAPRRIHNRAIFALTRVKRFRFYCDGKKLIPA
jgi:hypothetical protein